MEVVEVTLGTLDLREFEVFPKQRRRKKNKREAQCLMHPGTQGRAATPQEAEPDLPAGLGASPGEGRKKLWLTVGTRWWR